MLYNLTDEQVEILKKAVNLELFGIRQIASSSIWLIRERQDVLSALRNPIQVQIVEPKKEEIIPPIEDSPVEVESEASPQTTTES